MARHYRLGPARRVINALVSATVRVGLSGKVTHLLTTTGRKSGTPRTTPVNLIESDGDRWLVSPYGTVGWVRNVRASGQVSVRRGRYAEKLRATEVDPETAGPVLREYVRRVPVTAPFFDAKRGDPVDAFVAEAARHPVFRLSRLNPGA